jgi:predicted dehydrogenase
MSDPRVAVIGCGGHSTRNTFPSLRFTNLDLVAACDVNEEAAMNCARRFGAPRVVLDYRELLDPDVVDGVIIVVHATKHHVIAEDALRAGLHVFTEKPPSMTAAEALAVARVAREADKVCMTAFKKRYAPAYVSARRVIHEEIPPGERHLEYTYTLGHYRSGKDDPAYAFLLDAGIHAIDAVRFMMGEVVELVTFQSGGEGRESWAVALRFEDGSVGTLNMAARGDPRHGHEFLKVTGDRKMVLVDNVVDLSVFRHDGPTEISGPRFIASGNWTEVTTGFAGEMQAFEKLLREGARPDSDIESSYRSMALYEAIRDSQGRPTRPEYETV